MSHPMKLWGGSMVTCFIHPSFIPLGALLQQMSPGHRALPPILAAEYMGLLHPRDEPTFFWGVAAEEPSAEQHAMLWITAELLSGTSPEFCPGGRDQTSEIRDRSLNKVRVLQTGESQQLWGTKGHPGAAGGVQEKRRAVGHHH